MKILYIHQYFKTPEEGGSTRSYYLATGLASNGYEVTVLTAHNHAGHEVKQIDGLTIHYLPVSYDNSYGLLARLWSFGKFVWLARKEALKLSRFDLAYVMTTPLTTGFIATYLKKKIDLSYYFEVGDLWPEAPIKMGVIRNRRLQKWLYALEKKFYFEAEKVIALSPAIRNHIEKISPHTSVHVITNMADCAFFEPKYCAGDFSKTNKFHVTYCGAIGRANHLEYLLEAAHRCEALPVHFNIMGAGSELSRLKKQYRDAPNTSFYTHTSKGGVKELLERSDAVYVSFKDVDILGTGSPNKFFDSLAAAKLTILNFNGWIRDLVEKNKCGFYHDPHRPEDFVRKINVFLSSPHLLSAYQRNGRKLAELYYDKEIQVTKLLKILNNECKFEVNDSEVYILTA